MKPSWGGSDYDARIWQPLAWERRKQKGPIPPPPCRTKSRQQTIGGLVGWPQTAANQRMTATSAQVNQREAGHCLWLRGLASHAQDVCL